MTFKELIEFIQEHEQFPEVRHNQLGVGKVVLLSEGNDHTLGCGVQFSKRQWKDWFWDSDKSDKRTKYMRDLAFAYNYELTNDQ